MDRDTEMRNADAQPSTLSTRARHWFTVCRDDDSKIPPPWDALSEKDFSFQGPSASGFSVLLRSTIVLCSRCLRPCPTWPRINHLQGETRGTAGFGVSESLGSCDDHRWPFARGDGLSASLFITVICFWCLRSLLMALANANLA